MIEFVAEVTQVQVKKTLSMDKEFKVVLITNDEGVLELQQYISNDIIKIKVENNNDTRRQTTT